MINPIYLLKIVVLCLAIYFFISLIPALIKFTLACVGLFLLAKKLPSRPIARKRRL